MELLYDFVRNEALVYAHDQDVQMDVDGAPPSLVLMRSFNTVRHSIIFEEIEAAAIGDIITVRHAGTSYTFIYKLSDERSIQLDVEQVEGGYPRLLAVSWWQ